MEGREREQSWEHISLTSVLFGHVWPSWHAGLNNSWDLPMTVSCESISLFFLSSIFHCVCPVPPCIANFLHHSSLDAHSSTQAGMEVVHSPRLIRLWISPNSYSMPVITLFSGVVLKECSNTCVLLFIWSTRLATIWTFPKKALLYFRSKRPIWRGRVSITWLIVPFYLR